MSASGNDIKQDSETGADQFPKELQSLSLKYLDDQYQYQRNLKFFDNVAALYATYATQIAHNLLWNIKIDETLELAKQYSQCLDTIVEVKDPHGQRVRGKPLQIVAAAGDRNTKKVYSHREDFGLVERLRPCFPNPENYITQLKEWFAPDVKKVETQKTMAPYVNAINTLCREIIESKEIKESSYDNPALQMQMAEKFKQALIPNPKHVVTSGYLFDFEIFVEFCNIWNANINALGNLSSVKSQLFASIVFPALLARVQRCDISIFKNGFAGWQGEISDRLDFSKGTPEDVEGMGDMWVYSDLGERLYSRSGSIGWAAARDMGTMNTHGARPAERFIRLCQAKEAPLDLCISQQPTHSRCDIM